MKKLTLLMSTIILSGSLQAQDFFHRWQVRFVIIDDLGQPLEGATATVFYNPLPPSNQSTDSGKIEGLTDSNGVFSAAHYDKTYCLRFLVGKNGYYSTDIFDDFHGVFSPDKLNRNLTLKLKKVLHPVPMYARWVNENPPTLGQPVGYDLSIGDWVAPNRKGVNTDMIFEKEAYRKSGADYEYKVKITFPKSGDGIQIYNVPDSEKGSGLRSPHEAPVDGYQSTLSKERSAHPGQPAKNDDDPDRIYLFRVRTKTDDRGNIVSAHYGKIYGDFMQFTYYLNPNPNSRNIEFDPKQNLIGESPSFLRVQSP